MINFTRHTMWFVLALPLLLTGCGEAPEKSRAVAAPSTGARQRAKPPAKSTQEAKPPAADAKPAVDAKPAADSEEETEIKQNLAKLDPADRKIAEAQRFCVIEDENRLGSMGKPIKLTIKDKTVFICYAGCKKQALAEPDKTLAKVEELKKKSGAREVTAIPTCLVAEKVCGPDSGGQ